jgi:ubiquinone/menaquinone biosynthesis C-methylase UbiE
MSENNPVTKATQAMYDFMGQDGLEKWVVDFDMGGEVEYAKKFLQPGNTVLDLGCGHGRTAIPLSKYGARVYGLDISPELIRAAGKQSKLENVSGEFIVGDMCAPLPYASEIFDCVLCFWSTFFHVVDENDQISCLNDIYRVLKPTGFAVFLLADPENEYWRDKVEKANGRVVEMDLIAGHLVPMYVHNEETMEKLIFKTHFPDHQLQLRQIDKRRWLECCLFKSKQTKGKFNALLAKATD